MLDALCLGEVLGLTSSAELFGRRCDLLHSTSILRYPVFVRGKNYSGHSPEPRRHPYLNAAINEVFAPELDRLRGMLIVPLGRMVDEVVQELRWEPENRYLAGFPHPSGANEHRHAQFEAVSGSLKRMVRRWGGAL